MSNSRRNGEIYNKGFVVVVPTAIWTLIPFLDENAPQNPVVLMKIIVVAWKQLV
jgi:hypothetical protein